MSPCDPLYGLDRRINGFICSRGPKKGARAVCQFCGGLGAELLCDGPGPDGRKTCDAKMCGRCAVGVRSSDVDFCPRCAALPPSGACPVTTGVRPDPCSGPDVKKEGTCLKHAVLFEFWLSHRNGYAEVYSRKDLSQQQKRLRFRTWIQSADGQQRVDAFAARVRP